MLGVLLDEAGVPESLQLLWGRVGQLVEVVSNVLGRGRIVDMNVPEGSELREWAES